MDFREDDEAAKIELTYSTTSDINRAKPTLRKLVVCIIQVTVHVVVPIVLDKSRQIVYCTVDESENGSPRNTASIRGE